MATGCKDVKSHFTGLTASEPSSIPQRQRRLQDHGKERKELLSKVASQVFGDITGGLGIVLLYRAVELNKADAIFL